MSTVLTGNVWIQEGRTSTLYYISTNKQPPLRIGGRVAHCAHRDAWRRGRRRGEPPPAEEREDGYRAASMSAPSVCRPPRWGGHESQTCWRNHVVAGWGGGMLHVCVCVCCKTRIRKPSKRMWGASTHEQDMRGHGSSGHIVLTDRLMVWRRRGSGRGAARSGGGVCWRRRGSCPSARDVCVCCV